MVRIGFVWIDESLIVIFVFFFLSFLSFRPLLFFVTRPRGMELPVAEMSMERFPLSFHLNSEAELELEIELASEMVSGMELLLDALLFFFDLVFRDVPVPVPVAVTVVAPLSLRCRSSFSLFRISAASITSAFKPSNSMPSIRLLLESASSSSCTCVSLRLRSRL